MAKFILGKKVAMTQKFLEDGTVVPVTIVQAGPCTITQIKNNETDGYQALQIGFDKARKLSKSLQGHLKNFGNFRHLQEFKTDKIDGLQAGQVVDVTSFQAGDQLSVTAVSKGKGFQGVVRRHGFHGSPATHGHKDQLRMPGSIGSTGPQRVLKGTRMAGHMGDDQVTVHNLELVEVDKDQGLLYIKGAVPGARNTLVRILADGEMTFLEAKTKPEEKMDTATETQPDLTENEVDQAPVEVVEAKEEIENETLTADAEAKQAEDTNSAEEKKE